MFVLLKLPSLVLCQRKIPESTNSNPWNRCKGKRRGREKLFSLSPAPPPLPRVAFGLPYLLIEFFYIDMPVVRADVRSRDDQNFSDG